jgi:hypothetical protein
VKIRFYETLAVFSLVLPKLLNRVIMPGTVEDITASTIKVISQNSDFSQAEIERLYAPPGKDPKLTRFLSTSQNARLAIELKKTMKFVRTTELTNLLFVDITTLDQLIKKLIAYFNTRNHK